MILRLLIVLFSAFLLSCSDTLPDSTQPSGEISISQLKSLCKGDRHRIVENVSVRGVVLATSWLGELNNSAIIVDETGGLEVAIALRNISASLPIYHEVTILCDGLMLARIGGKIELGAEPTGDFPLDNIDDEMINRYIRLSPQVAQISPTTKRFNEIGSSDISSWIRFDNIRLCDEEQGLSWCDKVEEEFVTTLRTFVDEEGNTFGVQTLPTCIYAGDEIPTETISVAGVIDFSDNQYFLRIVNQNIIR